MAITVEIRLPQGAFLTAIDASLLRTSQLSLLSAAKGPTSNERLSQLSNLVAAKSGATNKVSQAALLVAAYGRKEPRKLRAWTFTLDGHDFYVLRLGTTSTLVYDLTTKQWSRWASPSMSVWRTQLGTNWLGMGATTLGTGGFAWNIVGGDDTTGQLWIVDPTANVDDNDSTGTSPFSRKATGVVQMRLRAGQQVGAVYLTANLGAPSLAAPTVTLKTSDDGGISWQDQGTVTVNSGDYTQELAWLGLGIMTAPGRLFSIEDSGAIARISSLDMRP